MLDRMHMEARNAWRVSRSRATATPFSHEEREKKGEET